MPSTMLAEPIKKIEAPEAPKRQHPACPFVPMGERVVLEMIKSENKKGLIHIPDNAVDAPQFAIVMAIGDLVIEDLAVGDEVSFSKYSGNVLKRNDKEYLVMMSTDILAKVKRD